MTKVALFVRLEAKSGKEGEVENFLCSGLPIVEAEPDTIAWFAIRFGPTTFGIFDAFPTEEGAPGSPLRESGGRIDGESVRDSRETASHRESRRLSSQASLIELKPNQAL